MSLVLLEALALPEARLSGLSDQLLVPLVFLQQLLTRIEEMLHRSLVPFKSYEVLQISQCTQAEQGSIIITVPGSRIICYLLQRFLFMLLALL